MSNERQFQVTKAFFSIRKIKYIRYTTVNSTEYLLPTGSEEREVLGFGSIPVTILPSCQDMKIIAI